MVEIQAKEAGVVEEFVFPADGESAGEGTVVEFLGFEHPGMFGVADEAEFLCAASGVSAGDVTPGIEEGYLLVGRDVADRGLEEGEVRLRDERGLEEDADLPDGGLPGRAGLAGRYGVGVSGVVPGCISRGADGRGPRIPGHGR